MRSHPRVLSPVVLAYCLDGEVVSGFPSSIPRGLAPAGLDPNFAQSQAQLHSDRLEMVELENLYCTGFCTDCLHPALTAGYWR